MFIKYALCIVFLSSSVGCERENQSGNTAPVDKIKNQNEAEKNKRKLEIMGSGELPRPKRGDPIPGL